MIVPYGYVVELKEDAYDYPKGWRGTSTGPFVLAGGRRTKYLDVKCPDTSRIETFLPTDFNVLTIDPQQLQEGGKYRVLLPFDRWEQDAVVTFFQFGRNKNAIVVDEEHEKTYYIPSELLGKIPEPAKPVVRKSALRNWWDHFWNDPD